jgi:hypothetical protein
MSAIVLLIVVVASLSSSIATTVIIFAVTATNANNKSPAIALIFLVTSFAGCITLAPLIAAPLTLEPQDIDVANGVLGSMLYALATLATSMDVTTMNAEVATNIPGYVIPILVNAGMPPTTVSDLSEALVSGKFTAVLGAGKNVVAAATESYQIICGKLQCRVSCGSGFWRL